ncbi:hypothetical protein HYC85_028210 [Camellia sinensis]|uniref:Uncharacterized protein n=1 Tax=Camellia sinensis TaxID=4442 RepID=A0A7J7FUS4_CAMSI|nr:hypothetical protein HYC85_028210 [Camellia sinensis]
MRTAYKYRLDRLNWNKTFHVCLFKNGLMVLLASRLRRGFSTCRRSRTPREGESRSVHLGSLQLRTLKCHGS